MTNKIEYIAIDKLVPHPDNLRKDVGDIAELAESIRRQGVLQNLTVVPVMDEDRYTDEYRVVIGHRRLAAAKLVGLRELPCSIATDMDYKTQLATMLSENMQRADLTLAEQVEGIQMMLDLGESVEAVSDATGLSESTVRRRAKLAELPREEFRASAERGGKLEDYARIGELSDPEHRKAALKAVGTPTFTGRIDALLADERWVARKAEIIGMLDGWAERAEKRPDGWSYMSEYGRWSNALPPQTPIGPDRKYIYVVADSYVTVYVEAQTATTPEDTAEAERKAKIMQRRDALKVLTKQAYERRRDFVLGMSEAAASTRTDKIIREVARIVFDDAMSFRADNILALQLGLDNLKFDDDGYEEIVTTTIEQVEPSRLLLMTWYAMEGDADNAGYYEIYGDPTHDENPDLDRVYDTLIAMGYEPTADEVALRDGTHELFGEVE